MLFSCKIKQDNLSYLKNFNGRYPAEVKLLDSSALANRLQHLVGSRYAFLKNTWAVETPVTVAGGQFVAAGCQQHNCAGTNFIIVVDFSKDVLYAGIREEGAVKTYSEDGSTNNEIEKWAAGN